MTVKTPVYLDYAATTPVDRRVAEKMIPYLSDIFATQLLTATASVGKQKKQSKKHAQTLPP